jgi:hypothetical protein
MGLVRAECPRSRVTAPGKQVGRMKNFLSTIGPPRLKNLWTNGRGTGPDGGVYRAANGAISACRRATR